MNWNNSYNKWVYSFILSYLSACQMTDLGEPISSSCNLSSSSATIWDTLSGGESRILGDTQLVDGRNQKSYKVQQIGSNYWMLENLDYGLQISWAEAPKIDDIAEGSCMDNQLVNCKKFGKYYTWVDAVDQSLSCLSKACSTQVQSTVRGICPKDWNVPSDSLWYQLDSLLVLYPEWIPHFIPSTLDLAIHYQSTKVVDSNHIAAWTFSRGGTRSKQTLLKSTPLPLRCVQEKK